MGDVLFSLGRINDAIVKYEYVNKTNDSIPEIYLQLGHCYFMREKFDLSINNYIEALKIVKNTRHDYYYYLGNALVAAGRVKDGIIAYQAAIKLKNDKLNYYFAIGKACYFEKLYKKGIKYLEKLVEIHKKFEEKNMDFNNDDIMLLLFKCYSSLDNIDYNKCYTIITGLLISDHNNVKYLTCLADLQMKTKHENDAIKTYKKILKIDPDNDKARIELEKMGEYSENENLRAKMEMNLRDKSSSSSEEDEEEEKEVEKETEKEAEKETNK